MMCECCGGDCRLCLGDKTMNDETKNEILEAYEKISNRFDEFTQSMRKECSERIKLCKADSKVLIKMGRVKEKLFGILNDEVFNSLSKHNPYWDSEHEQESIKLGDIRFKLSILNDNLWDLVAIMNEE